MANGGASSQPKMVVEGATKFYATQSGLVHALDNVSLEVRARSRSACDGARQHGVHPHPIAAIVTVSSPHAQKWSSAESIPISTRSQA